MGGIIISFLSASAYDFEVDGFYYETNLSNMTATIVAGDIPYSGDIIIPETVVYKERTFSIVSINGAFNNCGALTSVVIPDCISSLGSNAFSGCGSLYEILGMKGITEIGNYCFNGCSSLTTINLPINLRSIGSYAFANCI
ncbi:MAG: leucine-rich repeat domain-containing protein [Muribaculaceae bacterium]|nr:leucine-rich repeat domain-containing protein [Muribaculaceae bacterium]